MCKVSICMSSYFFLSEKYLVCAYWTTEACALTRKNLVGSSVSLIGVGEFQHIENKYTLVCLV